MKLVRLIAVFLIFILVLAPISVAKSLGDTVKERKTETKAAVPYCKTPIAYKDQYRYVAFANLSQNIDSVRLSLAQGEVNLLQNLLPPHGGEKIANKQGNEIIFQNTGVVLLNNDQGGKLRLSTDNPEVELAPTEKCGKLAASLATLHQKKLHESLEEKYKLLDKWAEFRKVASDIYFGSKTPASSSSNAPTGHIVAQAATPEQDNPYIRWEEYSQIESPEGRDIGMVGDKWGKGGAGLVIVSPQSNEILLLRRSKKVEEPYTWGIPGGARQYIEGKLAGPLSTALTETREELESLPKGKIRSRPYVYREGGFTYHNYVLEIEPGQKEQFEPELNWENTAYKWVKLENLNKLNLHPGVEDFLANNGFEETLPAGTGSALSPAKVDVHLDPAAPYEYMISGSDDPLLDFSEVDWSQLDYSELSWMEISVALTHHTEVDNIPGILEKGAILPPGETGAEKHGHEGHNSVFASPGNPGSMMAGTDAVIHLKPSVYKESDFASRIGAQARRQNILTDPNIRDELRKEFDNLPKLEKKGIDKRDIRRKLRSGRKDEGAKTGGVEWSEDVKKDIPQEVLEDLKLPGEPYSGAELQAHGIKVATTPYSKKVLLTDYLRYLHDPDFREAVNQQRIGKRKRMGANPSAVDPEEIYPEILEVITDKIPTDAILEIDVSSQGSKERLVSNIKGTEQINGQPIEDAINVVSSEEVGVEKSARLAERYFNDLRLNSPREVYEVEGLLEDVRSDYKGLKDMLKQEEVEPEALLERARSFDQSYAQLRGKIGRGALEPIQAAKLVKSYVQNNNPFLVEHIFFKARKNLFSSERIVSSRLLSGLLSSKGLVTASQKNAIQAKWSKLSSVSSKMGKVMRSDQVSNTLYRTIARGRNSQFRYFIPKWQFVKSMVRSKVTPTMRMAGRALYAMKSQMTLSNLGKMTPYAVIFAMGRRIGYVGKKQGDEVKIMIGHSLRLAGYYFMAKIAWNIGWATWVAYASSASVYAGAIGFLGATAAAALGVFLFLALTAVIIVALRFTCYLSIKEHLPWCFAHRFTPARRLIIPDREKFFLLDVPMIANYMLGDTIPVSFSFSQKVAENKRSESRQVGKATCQVRSTGESKICQGKIGRDLETKLPAGSSVQGHYQVTRVPDWFETAVYSLLKGKEVTVGQKLDRDYYLFGKGQDLCVQDAGASSNFVADQYEEYCWPVGKKVEEKFFLNSDLPFISLELKEEGLVCQKSRRSEEIGQTYRTGPRKRNCETVDQVLEGERKEEFETMAAEMPPRSVNQGLSASLQLETNEGRFVSKTFNFTQTKTLDKSDFYRLAFKDPYRSDETSGWFGRDHATGLDFTVENKAPGNSLKALEMTVKAVDYPEGRCEDDNEMSMSYKPKLKPGEIFKFAHNDFCDASGQQELQFKIKLSSLWMETSYCVKCKQDDHLCQPPVPGDCGQG